MDREKLIIIGCDEMQKSEIEKVAQRTISTSSKGDQSKWHIGNKWVKQNARGYEGIAEYVAPLIVDK